MAPPSTTGTTLSLAGCIDMEKRPQVDNTKIVSPMPWDAQLKVARELVGGNLRAESISEATRYDLQKQRVHVPT